ncbi:SH2 domain-containing protein 4B-like isoform X2 [Homalodisca vitripennis]|nr:SH2 domain-containing protein 4B-like isoform X2 [Homalodisca vitripennis]KAG8295569.1 negative regulation of phosphatase activity protein [Homalodisca vitripennis]KAG8328925.1 negative regulation of phosphatase activity protein [Homalodisca vitripennis]
MLKQILQDLWVHPDILAELDESQKQTLFCRMREEQVRRWKVWDQEEQKRPQKITDSKTSRKHVQFMLDAEGDPWTWVMGEHPDDKSIEQILEEEAREAARLLAEKEAQQLRLSVEAELTELLDINQKQLAAMEAAQGPEHEDIYCSVAEVKDRIKVPILPSPRDALQEISLNKPHKVSQRVAMWEKKVMEERTSQIFKGIQKKKLEAAKEAEEADEKREQLWKEQEKKAKEAEQKIREIARLAREEHRRSVMDVEMDVPQQSPDSPTPPKGLTAEQLEIGGPKPPSKEAIVEWFRSSELARRAGLEPYRNVVAPWFHGLISRQEAESLLNHQPVGCFLVRVSERIWGYAISYRDSDRCKHYLVDASNGHYQFLGTNQIAHNSLGELIKYHSTQPITVLGGELLVLPCARPETMPAICQGLGLLEHVR